jgi:antitoxin component YwqK of YwqJK toxin-antitoxin module
VVEPNKDKEPEKEYYAGTNNIKSIKKYTGDKLSSIETFYLTGRQESRVIYNDGIKNGAYQKFYDKDAPGSNNSTMLKESGLYKDDKICGAYYLYYDNGSKNYVLFYDTKTGKLKTSTEYDETGYRMIKSSDYNTDGKLIEASNYYASGQIKKTAKFVDGKKYKIEITTYEDGSRGKTVKSVVGYDGTEIDDALSFYKESVDADNYDAAKIQAVDDIVLSLSLFPPTTDELTSVEDYVKYLIKTNADIKKIDTIMKWLWSSYETIGISDKTSLLTLSKEFMELRAKTTPDFYTFNMDIDYKGMSAALRSYLDMGALNTGDKKSKSDFTMLLPLALKKLVSEINTRFAQGIDVTELMTKEESKMFTTMWASMVNDLYNDVNSNVKMDPKLVKARFLAVKDLSEILKASSASYSSSQIAIYTEAKYMMDETAAKAKEKSIIDGNMIENYNKDVELKYRAGRLESSADYY